MGVRRDEQESKQEKKPAAPQEEKAPRAGESEEEPEFSEHHYRELGDENPAGNYGSPDLPQNG